MDGVNDFESSITSMSDMWAMDKSFCKELPELSVISRPDAKLTDEANRATLESLEVLERIEMNTEYLKNIVDLLSVSNDHQKELNIMVQDILGIAKAPDKEEAQNRYRSVMKKIGDFSTITSSALTIVKLSSLASTVLQMVMSSK